MDKAPIKLSVTCMAYNHEEYIRDALEGFVSQRTDFPFEVLISDDASTDGTAAIIREYAENSSRQPGASTWPPARGTTAGPIPKSSSARWTFWTPIRTTPPVCTTAWDS